MPSFEAKLPFIFRTISGLNCKIVEILEFQEHMTGKVYQLRKWNSYWVIEGNNVACRLSADRPFLY